MAQWEYLRVGPIRYAGRNFQGDYAKITTFTFDGTLSVPLRPSGKISEDDVIAGAIARLGAEGWELTGVGNTGHDQHILYFKRPSS